MEYLIRNNVILMRAYLIFLVYLTQDESKINTNGMIQEKYVVIQLFFMIVLIPTGLITDIITLSGFAPTNFMQMLEYGLYRFKTRAIRWGHDKFDETCSEAYYKNVHNMGYSSQMYFFTSSIIFSMMVIWWGIYIIMRNEYPAFSDPAFMVIFIFVLFFMRLSSFLCTIVSSKLKIYNIKI